MNPDEIKDILSAKSLAKELVEELADEETHHEGIVLDKGHQQLQQQIIRTMEDFRESFGNGYLLLRGAENGKKFMIPLNFVDKIEKKGGLSHVLQDEGSLQAVLGYSDEVFDEMGKVAYSLLEENRLEDCIDVCVFLTLVNPFIASLWVLQGVAWEKRENPGFALSCFQTAFCMDPLSEEVLARLVKCCIELKEFEEGIRLVDIALEELSSMEDNDQEKVRVVQQMKDYLISEMNK